MAEETPKFKCTPEQYRALQYARDYLDHALHDHRKYEQLAVEAEREGKHDQAERNRRMAAELEKLAEFIKQAVKHYEQLCFGS